MENFANDYPGKKFREEMDKTLLEFENKIQKNPDDASAYVGFAESNIVLWCYGFLSYEDTVPKAKTAVLKALQLSDDIGLAHTLLGLIKMSEWDWLKAEKDFKRGIELYPDNPGCHHWYALYLAAMGRLDESLIMTKRAAELKPSPDFLIGLGSIYYFAHDFEILADSMEELIKKEPGYAPGYDWLGMAYCQLKKFDKSIEVYKKAVELSDGLAEIQGGLGHAYGMAGRLKEAREVVDNLNNLAIKYYIPPVQIAFIYAGLNDTEKMFEMLERAYRERSWELIFIREEPWFDDFHSDPRFLNLIKRLNFLERQI